MGLGGREGGLIPRAVGADLVALVQKVLFVQALQGPPDALDVGVVEGPVGVVHVYPEAEALAHLAPVFDVTEDRLAAEPVELLYAVTLNVGLALEPQLLLDLYLHRQPVAVPATLALDPVTLH